MQVFFDCLWSGVEYYVACGGVASHGDIVIAGKRGKLLGTGDIFDDYLSQELAAQGLETVGVGCSCGSGRQHLAEVGPPYPGFLRYLLPVDTARCVGRQEIEHVGVVGVGQFL